MDRNWLIDGHNLLHHDSGLEHKLQHRPAEAYATLAAHIDSRAQRTNRRARLILDGHRLLLEVHLQNTEVRFSGSKSADEAIKKILKKQGSSSRWILVTDDRELLRFAKTRGIATELSRAFHRQIQPGSTGGSDADRTFSRPPEKDPDVKVSDRYARRMALLWRLRDEDEENGPDDG